jgi:hypothetical protein
MVECLARAPVTRTPAEVARMLRDAGLSGRKVRVQMWLLGRLEGAAPFRLRDEVRVHQVGGGCTSAESSWTYTIACKRLVW